MEFVISAGDIQHVRNITRPATAKKKDREEWFASIEKLRSRPLSEGSVDKKTILMLVDLGFKLGQAKTFGGWIAADCALWETLAKFGITAADIVGEDES